MIGDDPKELKVSRLDDFVARSRYVRPSVGDLVLRHGDDSRAGLLYHVDAYAGGLPRAHVVFDDGSESHECLFLFQSPGHAAVDPCWGGK